MAAILLNYLLLYMDFLFLLLQSNNRSINCLSINKKHDVLIQKDGTCHEAFDPFVACCRTIMNTPLQHNKHT